MFDSLRENWNEIWEIDAARWVIYIALIGIVATVGYYLGKLFRDMAIGGDQADIDYLSEFEKLKKEGKMGEFEYVRVRSKLEQEKKAQVKSLLENDLPDDLKQVRQPDFKEVDDDDDLKPDSEPGPSE